MLDSTRLMIQRTINEIKFFSCLATVAAQLVTIAYMIYACFTGSPLFVVNILLAVVSAAYLVVYIATYGTTNREQKKVRSWLGDFNRRFKLIGSSIMLLVTIYGIYFSTVESSALTIIFATLSIILWILQVVIELVYSYVKYKSALFLDALRADFASIVEPVRKAGEFIRNVTDKDNVASKVKEIAGAAEEKIGGIRSFFSGFSKKRSTSHDDKNGSEKSTDYEKSEIHN